MVGERGPGSGGGVREADAEPLAAFDLGVVPERAAVQALRGQPRHEFQSLARRKQSPPRDSPLGRQVAVAISAQKVVHQQADGQSLTALRSVAVGGHQEPQGLDQGGSDAQEGGALAHGLAKAREIGLL